MYSSIFVGGTFDTIHKGHMVLLDAAITQGNAVTIGLTSDAFTAIYKKDKKSIQPFLQRKKQLEDLVHVQGWDDTVTIIAIDDPLEPAASGEWEALVVTPETKARGEEINALRKTRNLHPLILIEVGLEPAEDGEKISSTRIRNGDIDTQGKLVMPDSIRHLLAKPLGAVLSGDAAFKSFKAHMSDIIVTVGDITTKTALDAGVKPNFAIIDLRVGRKSSVLLETRLSEMEPIKRVSSGPGFISKEALDEIIHWSKTLAPLCMIVDGEEDLLVLPVVVHAPVGCVVYYGQPGVGMVEVVVTAEKKKEAIDLLSLFT